MQKTVNGKIIRLVEGDITALDVDAIVNAANEHLQLGSGVAGAIRRKGGPSIQRECNQIGHCPVGSAVITGGGGLPAEHVIHAVGPMNRNPKADELLQSATSASLKLAAEHGLRSIAFPAISTGVFGYPMDKCAHHMLHTTWHYLAEVDTPLQEVVFCLYGGAAFGTFEDVLASLA
jgi:O-acetyl-ADP-ribose deacetylase (regulator of RNase III)